MWIEDQAEGNTISLSKAKSYMDMLQISGWAADFESDTPLTDLIAEVNGKNTAVHTALRKKALPTSSAMGCCEPALPCGCRTA